MGITRTTIIWYLIGVIISYTLLKIDAVIEKEENTWKTVGERLLACIILSWVATVIQIVVLCSKVKIPKCNCKPPKWL